MKKLRINILDPGLMDKAGHHFDLDMKLSCLLSEQGHEVHVYSNVLIRADVQSEIRAFASLTPLFRAGPYQDPKKQDAYAGELITYQAQSEVLAADLLQVTASDIWIWPTLMSAQLRACALRKVKVPIAACVQSPVVCHRYPHGTIWWRDALLAANRADLRLNIGAIDQEHQYEYLPLMANGNFTVFPSYFDGIPPSAPRTSLKTIGLFGHQRPEKGAFLIKEIVDELVAIGYRVIVTDSGNKLGLTGRPGLTVLGFVPSLSAEMVKCDLVVLPYEPDRYRNRSSGVIMDALASGLPAVVPFGTMPGRWIDRTGAGTQFVELQTNQVLAAIECAHANFSLISGAAYRASLSWKKKHGIVRFAKALLGGFPELVQM